jgi:hypothetical protein
MLPALLGAAGIALAAPSAAEWFLGLPARYGSDTWSRSRKNMRSAFNNQLTDTSFEDLDLAMASQHLGAERTSIENMRENTAGIKPMGGRERAIEDQFLISQITRDYGQEIARVARTQGPSMMEIAARMGIDMGGPNPG